MSNNNNKGNRLRFSKTDDEKLINEVAMHPALYDLKHELYKDQNVRDNIWKIVSEKVNKSGKFINYNNRNTKIFDLQNLNVDIFYFK